MKKLLFATILLAACEVDENIALTGPGPGHHEPSSVGDTRWSVLIGGADDDRATALAVDSIGDVIVLGGTSSHQIDFGSGPTMMPTTPEYLQRFASFVTKRVASDGAERWTRVFTPLTVTSGATALDVAVAADDDILVVGNYVGTVDFGGQTLSAGSLPNRAGAGFLARYASDGQLRWVHGFDFTGYVDPWTVAVDALGQIYVSGVTAHMVDRGGYDEPVGHYETFLCAFDAAGTQLWGTVFTSSAGTMPEDLAVAENGDVLLVGHQVGSAEFGGATLDAGDFGAIFLARYRSEGLYLSSRLLGGAEPYRQASEARLRVRGEETIVQYFAVNEIQPGATHIEGLDATNHTLWTTMIPGRADYSSTRRGLVVTSSGLVVSSSFNVTLVPGDSEGLGFVRQSEMEVATFDDEGHDGIANMWSTAGGVELSDTALAPGDSIIFAGMFSGTGEFGAAPIQTTGLTGNDIVLVATEAAASNIE